MSFNGIDFITIKKNPLLGTLTIHTRGASFSVIIDGTRSANDVLDSLSSVSQVIAEALGYHNEEARRAEMEAIERRDRDLHNKIIEADIEASHQPPEGAPSEPHEEERL